MEKLIAVQLEKEVYNYGPCVCLCVHACVGSNGNSCHSPHAHIQLHSNVLMEIGRYTHTHTHTHKWNHIKT